MSAAFAKRAAAWLPKGWIAILLVLLASVIAWKAVLR
jgi:hypothetical protein